MNAIRCLSVTILLALTASLSACNIESPNVFKSPLRDASIIVTPTAIPNPPFDKGAITGRFIDYISGEPITEMVIHLGELSPLKVEDTDSHIITILPGHSLSTTTDKYGYFAFLNIKPGTYAMVMWTPGKSWVVSDPETKLDILVTVEAGRITNLGEIAINLP